MKKSLIRISVSRLLATNSFGLSLKETVDEVLKTNPIIHQSSEVVREVKRDNDISKSGWLPKLDLVSSYGINSMGNLKDESDVASENYREYTNSLKLSQNLFDGFKTTNEISYQNSRLLAATNNFIETINDVAFQATQAYIGVIRTHLLYENAIKNVEINEKIYNDVEALYKQGLTTKSEMSKISASLSLAKSNVIVSENNAKEAVISFENLVGRTVNPNELVIPELNSPIPNSLDEAIYFALDNNPSSIVQKHNIDRARTLYEKSKGNYLPTVDFHLEQSFNGVDEDYSRYGSEDDRLSAYITLSWNLYNGGIDSNTIKKTRHSIDKENAALREIKRKIIESMKLAWSSYKSIEIQLRELERYSKYSKETMERYISEYELGRRTLLDLLSAQQDLNNSKSEIINAKLDKLFAHYRMFDSMGILVENVYSDGGFGMSKPVYEFLTGEGFDYKLPNFASKANYKTKIIQESN